MQKAKGFASGRKKPEDGSTHAEGVINKNTKPVKQRPVLLHSQRQKDNNKESQGNIQWRIKHRLKTVSAAIALCLNVGVDPPDVAKVAPFAKLQAWIDPFTYSQNRGKAVEVIGQALQAQYEKLQPRARYKLCPDPTLDEVKKTCTLLRRSAKTQRVLFHYNGHGVPKPTTNSEVWVFNKDFTQYIPMSLYDLNTWIGSPTIYILDANAAGLAAKTLAQIFAQNKLKDNLVLAACSENESLPTNASYPADLFTSCLTTPIKAALKYFVKNNKLVAGVTDELIEAFLNQERFKAQCEELHSIFNAVADTIAWSILPKDTFQKLFRHDLMVATLFRNYFLANRIMLSLNCTTVTFPPIPKSHDHYMWKAWDFAVDACISQIVKFSPQKYQQSLFFSSQLQEFENWMICESGKKVFPDQLPAILQLLLNPSYRKKALLLLARFVDLGTWAIDAALSVGIMPYMIKLLKSDSKDFKHALSFLWSKILAADKSCQADLIQDAGHYYFIDALSDSTSDYELKTLSCFVIGAIADEFPEGQALLATQTKSLQLLSVCLQDPGVKLRTSGCFSIAAIIKDHEPGRELAISLKIQDKIVQLLVDEVPEVRAAAVYCLGTMLKGMPGDENYESKVNIVSSLYRILWDASPYVRLELLHTLIQIVKTKFFSPSLLASVVESFNKTEGEQEAVEAGEKKVFTAAQNLYRCIVVLTTDSMPEVSETAKKLLAMVHQPDGKHGDAEVIHSVLYQQFKATASNPSLIENRTETTSSTTPQKIKQKRKEIIYQETLATYKFAGNKKLEDQIGIFGKEGEIISLLKFHPFEPYLLASDDFDRVSVWNWVSGKEITSFKVGSYLPGKIQNMQVINEWSPTSMLLITTNVGRFGFFKDYDTKQSKLVSAFQGAPEMTQADSSVVSQWQPQHSLLYVGGKMNYVKIWDVQKEICLQNVQHETEATITSITSDNSTGFTFAAGCSDGSLLIFDRRQNNIAHKLVSKYKEHKHSIIYSHMQKVNNFQVVTGSMAGDVKFWDTRTDSSVYSFEAHKNAMSILVMHDYAPVLASASHNHVIKVFNTVGESLSTIYYHDGFIGQRIGPVSSLAFHPYKMCLAAATDSAISIYAGNTTTKDMD